MYLQCNSYRADQTFVPHSLQVTAPESFPLWMHLCMTCGSHATGPPQPCGQRGDRWVTVISVGLLTCENDKSRLWVKISSACQEAVKAWLTPGDH